MWAPSRGVHTIIYFNCHVPSKAGKFYYHLLNLRKETGLGDTSDLPNP